MIPSSVRSRYIRVPLTTAFLLCKNAQLFCKSATRHPCRALNKRKFPALCVLIRNCSRLSYLFHAADGALRGVPAGRGSERPYERSKGKTTVLRLRSEKDGSEGEASPFVKDSNSIVTRVLTKYRLGGTISHRLKSKRFSTIILFLRYC